MEIKNIAVTPAFQGQGIGRFLLEQAILTATQNNYREICIGTSNSSLGQLHLYQKIGFDLQEIKRDFFLNNYQEPIFENGIQAKHLLILTKLL